MIPGHPHPSELVLDEPTRRLCAAITGGDLAPVRLAVIAPGGYGKSALLDLLATTDHAQRYRRGVTAPLILVDDAHLLGDNDFADLRERLEDNDVGVVVAARPRPRPAQLAALLGRLKGQVVLRPFDRARTAACLRQLNPVSDDLITLVHQQTGGVPGLVHRVAPHLRAETVGPQAIEEFRFDLDRLDADQLTALLAAEVGAGPGLLDRPEAVEDARATGLLAADGSLIPLAAQALRALVPHERRAAVLDRLAELRLARTGPLRDFAKSLLDAGATTSNAGAVYAAATAEADPVLAVELHRAAAAAGHETDQVARAEAEARAGDLDAALRRADALLAKGDRRAAHVAAAALAHRGQPARSAELYCWAGAGPLAAIGLASTGRVAEAREALRAPAGDGPPTLFAAAISLAARGVLDSIDGDDSALSTVVRAAEVLEPVGRDVLLPDTPAALGAILALHRGAAGIAEPMLARAQAAGTGGDLLAPRHALLAAWAAMVRGDAVPVFDPAGQAPRDWLFAVGLAVGAARRGSDLVALRKIWEHAYEAVVRHEVDLFTLLPLGEFAVAAARLGDRERFAPHLAQAWDLVRALGNPPTWTTMLHWCCLHAEIIAEHPEAAAAHSDALAGNASAGPFHATMAEAAAVWREVLTGQVDADRVEAAARGLHAAGLCWDGARLAGQAAIRTTDRKRMVTLLDCARALRGSTVREDTAADHSGMTRLSERELQVAELVLDGLTYKQVGDRLFISAKTVEHHVARMRARLGATSRADLLAQLRALVSPQRT
ncbi:LuxR C-terminal-related transcriptional regulator [Actinokineospora sp. NBRC 105648]|uniref:LuxR C-terminal-related transcriptional regulator n=1 Tax=Actinokineospora sp. NBRC 105648 TaxID=3032206 RepID=UPI0024A12BAC|nr:LuxR C-terminal-related transcriptional regulator [Actinokineospora sp. NBRC 105648]GLZ36416.1 helix-turn-helix transcriptional regulator [Actinokineospora sp. NBRC 105648]